MICMGKRSQGCMRVARYMAWQDKAMVRVGQPRRSAILEGFQPSMGGRARVTL
jgi:hypothetical protein